LFGRQGGAQGISLKNALHKELLDDPRQLRARKQSPRRLPWKLPSMPRRRPDPAEINVLRLIAAGRAKRNRRSALHDGRIGEKPVRSILSKLGASDRTHATTIALRRGIIEL
jgi:DNA-binding CsgD family transcriptional regulator